MDKPTISSAEFFAKAERDELVEFKRRDLVRFDYDPPKERVALISWHHAGALWRVIAAGDARRWVELHDLGLVLFGPSPWRSSCVLRVTGRLGSVEAAVSRLGVPDPSFSYAFEASDLLRPVAVAVVPPMAGGAAPGPRPAISGAQRARWRRANERQGVLL